MQRPGRAGQRSAVAYGDDVLTGAFKGAINRPKGEIEEEFHR